MHIYYSFVPPINPIFNVEDLTVYSCHCCEETRTQSLPITSNKAQEIGYVIKDQNESIRQGGCKKFTVEWRYKPISFCFESIRGQKPQNKIRKHVTASDFK